VVGGPILPSRGKRFDTLWEMVTREGRLRHALFLSALSIALSGITGSAAVYGALAGGSLSLLGFGADAVIDAGASLALVWRFREESRHPERASRVETVAERAVGSALIVLGLYLIAGSIRSLVAQARPEASFAILALLLASVVVLPPLAAAKYLVAAGLASGALRADSVLTAVAALLAVIGLLSLVLSDAFGIWWADAIAAFIVAGIVMRLGWRVWRPRGQRPGTAARSQA
jgi:divalent metal cation (Fe/Co/Zn/Cd) transporter